jgi:hypothetical protein
VRRLLSFPDILTRNGRFEKRDLRGLFKGCGALATVRTPQHGESSPGAASGNFRQPLFRMKTALLTTAVSGFSRKARKESYPPAVSRHSSPEKNILPRQIFARKHLP